ncbi:sterol desaturase family protein [Fretibacter rubidus]|uniref:sterol desaturase family protein n=1 Tax=Fretibacter rubidus TaxID=570162 RepID=UPI00352ABCE2
MADFPDVLLYAAPFFGLAVLLEVLYLRLRRVHGAYMAKDAAASMSMGAGQLLSDILMGFISFGILMFIWQFRLFDWGYSPLVFFACLIAQDFVYYYKHYAAHRIRWFWSAHVVHHSSEHYNLSTALRQPWNNHITGFVLLSSPLVLLGFHPLLIGFVGAVNLVYQFWIHTETIKKMPRWFEFIFNTPSHHRVHHATNPQYLDSNFAGIFIIWDRIFGTFVAEDEADPVRYGVVKPIETFNPVRIAFGEMIGIFKDSAQGGISLRQRFGYIFGPPGYSHDGSRQTSGDIKREAGIKTRR